MPADIPDDSQFDIDPGIVINSIKLKVIDDAQLQDPALAVVHEWLSHDYDPIIL